MKTLAQHVDEIEWLIAEAKGGADRVPLVAAIRGHMIAIATPTAAQPVGDGTGGMVNVTGRERLRDVVQFGDLTCLIFAGAQPA